MLTYATALLLCVWLGLFLLSRETRREQLLMSLVGLVLTPGAFAALLLSKPVSFPLALTTTVEPIIFALSLFGIAAVAYQSILHPKISRLKSPKKNPKDHPTVWIGRLLIILSLWVAMGIIGLLVLQLSPLTAMAASALLVAVYIIADRKDLLFDSVCSGLLIATLVLGVEQWLGAVLLPAAAFAGRTGILLGGLPIEEVFWAATVGFAVGPLYEYVRNERLITKRNYASKH